MVDVESGEWERLPVPRGLFAVAGAGLVLGLMTVATLIALYPPAKGQSWVLVVVGGGSALLVTALWAALGMALGLRIVADWFMGGYAIAMVLLAAVLCGREAVFTLREKAPGLIGVKDRVTVRQSTPG
jgi:hypothetical protein